MIHERIERFASGVEEGEVLRAGIYARTSTKSREYGYSLEEQVEKGIERCESLGWEVQFVFSDEAESGTDTNRPMFQQLLRAAEQRLIDVVVFWRLDRFSRSLIHAVQLEEKLRKHDVYLYSLTEHIDTITPTGRFNFRNIASAAEYERDSIRQRSNMTVDALAANTKWPNGNPPYGYNLTEDGRLSINDTEASVVRLIFELYIELKSMPQVAFELNERQIESSEGAEWTGSVVGDILRNKIYIGRYELAGVSKQMDEYEIIDIGRFQRVTKIRHRYQDARSSVRRMELTRKSRLSNRVLDQYRDYLTEAENC